MTKKSVDDKLILVVDEVEETRDAIVKLLTSDGYRVSASRDEQSAIESGRQQHPELVLMSGGARCAEVIATVRRIREHACPERNPPVVIFAVETIAEGAEMDIGENIHLVHPDDFNQLRRLVHRLVHQIPSLSRA